jgi:hypothetical protein
MRVGILLESLTNRQDFICSLSKLDDKYNYYIIREQLSPSVVNINLPILSLDKIYFFDGLVICFNLEHVKKLVNSLMVSNIVYYVDNIDFTKDIDYISNIKTLNNDKVAIVCPTKSYSHIMSNYINKTNTVVENYNIPAMIEKVCRNEL